MQVLVANNLQITGYLLSFLYLGFVFIILAERKTKNQEIYSEISFNPRYFDYLKYTDLLQVSSEQFFSY